MSDITTKTEKMSLALIQLAYTPPAKEKSDKQTISSGQALLKLKNMEQVLLPTHTLKISKSGNYLQTSDFCGISQFSASYSMVGGINAPKKIGCIGTDGKVRPQLLKGRDDLRYFFVQVKSGFYESSTFSKTIIDFLVRFPIILLSDQGAHYQGT